MSIEVHSVQRVRAIIEAAGSFAIDQTSSPGLASFLDLAIREGSGQLTLTRDSLDPQQLVQSRVEYRKEVLGKRSATFAFTLNLAPTGVVANSTTVTVLSNELTILGAIFGGSRSGNEGSTAQSASTATVINVATGHGVRFAAGGALGWVNASGVLETREIESISTDAITLKHALSGSPASSDIIYNCVTIHYTEDPTTSVQMLVEGVESDDRWLLLGGQAVGGVQLAIDPSGQALPGITVNMTFADWKQSNETAGTVTGTIGTATYSNYLPITGHAGELRVFTVGASTLNTSSLVHCSAIAFAPAVAYGPVTSPSGKNTIFRWRASRAAPPATGSWTSPYEALTRWTERNNRTDKAVFYQMGAAAGQAVLISAPTVQLTNPQRVADGSDIAAETVEWKARRDTDVGSSTTELAKSPFRLHFF
jgi:hypothetical protein